MGPQGRRYSRLVDLPLGAVTCTLGGCKNGMESLGAARSCFMTPLGGSVVVVRRASFWHCARSVSEACQKLARRAPEVWSTCARSVAEAWPKCARRVVEVWPKCGRSVAEVCPKCARSVPEVCPTCARSVPEVCPKCARSVPEVCPKWCPKWCPKCGAAPLHTQICI